MIGPSPIGWENRLSEYRKQNRDYFAWVKQPQKKEQIVLAWTQAGFSPRQIHEGTGFSVAFVHDVHRRFAHDCLVRYVSRGMRKVEGYGYIKERTK